MPPMSMTLTLEREAAARPPRVYAWRFPAEFRSRPRGWTERSLPQAPSQPAQEGTQDSSVGEALPPEFPLDPGPPSFVRIARATTRIEGSNQPLDIVAPALALDASRAPANREPAPQIRPKLLDSGPPCLLAPPIEPHQAASNTARTRLLELDILPAAPAAPPPPPPSALSIGDPPPWERAPPAPSEALLQSSRLNEASYAV